MRILNKTIEFETKGIFDFVDITEKIENFIKESQIKNGLINIYNPHATAGLVVNENEPFLIEDFKNIIERSAPQNLEYKHNKLGEGNGHSHCKAVHLPVNLIFNLIDYKLQLGTWQRILSVELDRPRKRKIQIQIIGT